MGHCECAIRILPQVIQEHADRGRLASMQATQAVVDAPTPKSHPVGQCSGSPKTRQIRACFVAPRHRDDPDWAWLSEVGPLAGYEFQRFFIDNTYEPLPKLTRLYKQWQYRAAASVVSRQELAFLFSTDVVSGLTGFWTLGRQQPPRIYVGFTQDGHWPQKRIDATAKGLRRCEAVTMFCQEERRVLVPRYGLDAAAVHVVPIHTDETDGYRHYPDESPRQTPYVLSLGSPNRRFASVARACRDLEIPLVIMTRPHHRNDSLEELAALGAEVITDADKMRALTYLKHAAMAVMTFDDPTIPGGFTTLVHAMFMRTPFVVSQCLGMAEHVIDGESGYVTPHDDERSLREAISGLWSDPARATQFGAAALRRAQQRHSLEAASMAFDKLARSLTSGLSQTASR